MWILVVTGIVWLLWKLNRIEEKESGTKKGQIWDKEIKQSPVVQEEVKIHVVNTVPHTEEKGSWWWMHHNPGMWHTLYEKPEGIAPVLPMWYIQDWVRGMQISPAEQLIITELDKYQIAWSREVSFCDMELTENGGVYRYDFLLPDHRIIIEYHGRDWHSSPSRIQADRIKELFCNRNSIELITYSGAQYYHMTYEIGELMDRLSVIKKAV